VATPREEFLAAERERVAKRATISVVSARLLPWLGGLSSLPDDVLEAARAPLQKARGNGLLRDFRVAAFGNDLHLQLNTLGKGLQNPEVHRLAHEACLAALSGAAQAGLYQPRGGRDLLALPVRDRLAALQARPVELPFTERGAEPIVVAKLMNGATGAFNRMLFNLFFHPDKGSHQRLDGARFIAIVEGAGDLAAGKADRRLFAFGDRPLEDRLILLYPLAVEPLELARNQFTSYLARCERAGVSRLDRTTLPLVEFGIDVEKVRAAAAAKGAA